MSDIFLWLPIQDSGTCPPFLLGLQGWATKPWHDRSPAPPIQLNVKHPLLFEVLCVGNWIFCSKRDTNNFLLLFLQQPLFCTVSSQCWNYLFRTLLVLTDNHVCELLQLTTPEYKHNLNKIVQYKTYWLIAVSGLCANCNNSPGYLQ